MALKITDISELKYYKVELERTKLSYDEILNSDRFTENIRGKSDEDIRRLFGHDIIKHIKSITANMNELIKINYTYPEMNVLINPLCDLITKINKGVKASVIQLLRDNKEIFKLNDEIVFRDADKIQYIQFKITNNFI